MTNLLSLSNELIAKIVDYTDSGTKKELSMVGRRINAVVLATQRCIRVFPPPSRLSFESYPSDIPEDILVKVICRYPDLKKIIFGGLQNNWSAQEVPYLKSLISYLESNHEKHPLSSVKKIQYREITRDMFGDFDEVKAKELNSRFLSSIGHQGLENVRIKAYHIDSILTGTEIQPVLKNSPNLKTFIFDGFQSNQTVSLSFASQPQLSKVKLLNWRGPSSTIESLRNCTELQELVIEYGAFSTDDIKAILLEDHPWNLKRLELKGGVAPRNDAELDAITKKIPNLECLGIDLQGVSDEGMGLLGRNCPNLKILQFSNQNLTNSGLDRLTRHLPHLEIISFDLAYNITEEGIAAIARNCKKLRFIRVVHFKKIEKSGIDALIENCQDLRVVGFSFGGPISIEAMSRLVKQMSKLRHVELYGVEGGIQDIQEELKKRKIRRVPYVSSAKKLHNLTK